MFQKGQRLIIGIALVVAVGVGSAVIANAASNGSTTTKDSTSTDATEQQDSRHEGPGQEETALTGAQADKATAAAKAKVPGGTVERVESDSGSAAYEAHVRKSDGTEVIVLFNSNLEITGVEAHNEHGPGDSDHGGPGDRGDGGPGADETALTGAQADKATAAAKDKVPGGTVLRVESDSGSAAYEAHVRKSDGTEVVVLFDKDLNVTGVEDFAPHGQTP
jgi:uncharacterized membrane protein YkoI